MASPGENGYQDLPFPPSGRSIGSQALSGVTWVGTTKAIRHGLQYLLYIVLARILLPSHFGVFGIVLILIELGVLLNELGLTATLIQRREVDREDTYTAFWGGLGVSVVLFAVLCALGGALAAFFGQPELRHLVVVGGLAFVFASVGTVPVALLSRGMHFRKLLVPEVGGVLVGNGVAIAIALSGGGAKSLVWGQAVTAGTVSVLALRAARWRPRWCFQWSRMRSLFSFGGYLVGRRLVDYVGASLVYLLIAKLLGDAAAGLYLLILRPTTLPQFAFGSVLGRVGLSAFSRVQEENERINRGFLLITRYTVLFSVPILCILSALAPEFLTGIYGSQWAAGAAPLAVLAMMGLINAAVSQPGVVWIAKGRAGLVFAWAVLMAFTVVVAGLAGVRWGLLGVTVALALRSLIFFPIPPLITRRVTGLGPRDYYRVLLPYAAAGGILWTVVTVLGRLPFLPWPKSAWFSLPPELIRLGLLSCVGVLTYGLIIHLLRPETWQEMQVMWKRLRAGGEEVTDR